MGCRRIGLGETGPIHTTFYLAKVLGPGDDFLTRIASLGKADAGDGTLFHVEHLRNKRFLGSRDDTGLSSRDFKPLPSD
jgi:hypothetical protein